MSSLVLCTAAFQETIISTIQCGVTFRNTDMFQEQPEAVGGSSSPRGSNSGSPAAAPALAGVSSSTHRQRRSPSVPTAAVAPSPLHTEDPPTRVSNNVEQLFTRTRPASTTSVPGIRYTWKNLPLPTYFLPNQLVFFKRWGFPRNGYRGWVTPPSHGKW